MSNPGKDRFTSRLRDFELHRTLGFLLHDNRARRDSIAVGDIIDAQLHEIGAAQFAVERQIEQREFALAIAQLQTNPDSPNVPEFQGRFLSDQLAFVPGLAAARYDGCQHLELLLCEGSSKRESHPLEGISTGRQISPAQFDSADLEDERQRVMMTHC
jgi:hypothetical protein